MLTREKIWKQSEAMDIVSPPKLGCSLPKLSCLVWEALVWEKHIPKPVPNGTKKIPCHVDASPWQHAKFHQFQTRFGFTRILMPGISMFAAEWRWHGVWHSFPFLAWDLRKHPRTKIWFFNQFICTRACACSSNLNYAHKMPRKPS